MDAHRYRFISKFIYILEPGSVSEFICHLQEQKGSDPYKIFFPDFMVLPFSDRLDTVFSFC